MSITSLSGTWTISWPYPRALFLNSYLLAINLADWGTCTGAGAEGYDSTILFELENIDEVLTATAIARLSSSDDVKSVDVADFIDFYIVSCLLQDDTSNVFYRVPNTDTDSVNMVEADGDEIPLGSTICEFKGQVIIGGLKSDNYRWKGLGASAVAWSGIGSLVFDPKEDQTAGFTKVKCGNRVHKVLGLDKGVVVYGDKGCGALIPISVGGVVGFGSKQIDLPGISSNLHVAGNANTHCILDVNYDLWTLDNNLEATKLGYREFMKTLSVDSWTDDNGDDWLDDGSDDFVDFVSKDIIISYVAEKKRFYISGADKGYVLTEFGLYESHQRPTSVGVYRGELIGFFGNSEDYDIRIRSDSIDFGIRGFKTLEEMEVGIRYRSLSGGDPRNLKASVKFKSNYQSDAFTQADWKNLNPEGFCMPIISAHEFQIQVKGDEYRDATISLDYINAWFKVVDKRGLRGRYNASRDASRAGG